VLNLVTSFVLFICKLFVVAGVGIISYYWVTELNTSFSEDLNYFGAVVLVCCVIAYLIADQFLNVYDMAVDTIFLCFAEDEKRNNGKVRLRMPTRSLFLCCCFAVLLFPRLGT